MQAFIPFNTDEDLQSYLPVTNSFSLETLATTIKRVVRNLLFSYISEEQYLVLYQKYQDNDLDETTLRAWHLIQEVVGYFAYFEYLPFSVAQVSDGGMSQVQSNDKNPLYKYQYTAIELAIWDDAHEVLDELLAYMENRSSSFTEWKNSHAYTVFKESFVRNAPIFSKYVKINNSRVLFYRLKDYFEPLQQDFLQPLLGTALYEDLLQKSKSETLNTAEAQFVLKYINRYLSYLVFQQALPELPLTFKQGIFRLTYKDDDNTAQLKPSEDNELDALQRNYNQKVESAKTALLNYLQSHTADFPLFLSSPCYVAVTDTPINSPLTNLPCQSTFWC